MRLSNMPCETCKSDTLFVGMRCNQCGNDFEPLPEKPPTWSIRKTMNKVAHANAEEANAKKARAT